MMGGMVGEEEWRKEGGGGMEGGGGIVGLWDGRKGMEGGGIPAVHKRTVHVVLFLISLGQLMQEVQLPQGVLLTLG